MANEEYRTSRDSYGLLLNPDALLHRKWFKELVRLQGINVVYKAVINPTKQYTQAGEVITEYAPPKLVGCIFEEHPNQWTMKKMGWVSELQEDASIIHVPYDLENIQVGALFIVPSGIDNSIGRVFRVTRMSNIMIYPASIACEIVPEYKDDFEHSQMTHINDTFNLLNEEDD